MTGDPIGDFTNGNLDKYLSLPKDNGFGGCEFGQKAKFNIDENNECEFVMTSADQCTTLLNP